MIANLLPLVFLALQPATAADGPAAPPASTEKEAVSLPADQQGAIRCSAAFALIAERQRLGEEAALEYPPLAERGREFFVQASARVMDESELDRAAISAQLRSQAQSIVAEGTLDQIMPPCLMLLEASGI
ncbi:hypothetical protein [Alteriqipengyuania lutimaris]|uniref:Uncharacterized protein n=1 Tax=Alteriqipengyuania lutimaris TaxID=1538146 RepID=A0A395LJY4_9SPHN|nr:hypothetical protein [Alteriqipengyuania lutimaris]MBB3033766.1 hypothetical protein [Alteriqipengyuania lutimaris]RDS77252.1 hypothetical protein DL238_06250 [Alteriqipengyuania lutimaris]